MKLKRIIKLVLLILLSVLLIAGIAFTFFIYKISNEPFMDDGPFTGATRKDCQLNNPNSEIKIYEKYTLQSFNSKAKDESPTVRLLGPSQEILWCIYANGYKETDVYEVSFSSSKEVGYDRILVKGGVYWTYGHERALWYINNDGKLLEYWYSW